MLALRYAAALCLGVYLVSQVKKPDRFAGRFFAWLMNGSHAPLTDLAGNAALAADKAFTGTMNISHKQYSEFYPLFVASFEGV